MIDFLEDPPPCPMCDTMLSLRSMPDADETHWHCEECGTQWEVSDLIEALNTNIILAGEEN